jgi:putative membrane protein
MGFLVRIFITSAALWAATRLVPGISYVGGYLGLLGVALIFGIVNAFVGTLLKLLAFPFVVLTLGIMLLVINGLMLMLTSSVAAHFGLGFHVAGFWPAFLGAIVIAIVGALLSMLARDDGKGARARER